MSGFLKCSSCGAESFPYAIAGGCCGWKLPSGKFCPGPIIDTREQARLARIREQARQLSLEECVYWLVIAEAIPAAKHAAAGHVWGVEAEGRYYAMCAEERRFRRWARQYIVIARLCFEAKKRIREARR